MKWGFGNSKWRSYQSGTFPSCCSVFFYGIMKDVNALFGMVDYHNVEAMAMRWRKRDLWKAGIVVAGVLLFLVLMLWVPVSAAGARERALRFSGPGTITVQATPTVDLTVTAVVKDQLKQQDEKLQRDNSFPWSILNAVGSSIGTILVAVAALVTAWLGWRQWLRNRQDEQKKRDKEQERWEKEQEAERRKRDEERFQAVVGGLGSEREEAKVGAAIMLRTFLQQGYEQLYTQTLDLAVAHLRLPRTPHSPKDPDDPLPLTTLRQALVVVFKEAFPLARNSLKEQKLQFNPQYLDASLIRLDNAFLFEADLNQAWMPLASLRKADLGRAHLCEAKLRGADLREAKLDEAHLREANLNEADLRGADLTGANLGDALSLEGTDLRGVTGLTKEQLAVCKEKGAIIDEGSTTSSPFHRLKGVCQFLMQVRAELLPRRLARSQKGKRRVNPLW
jgi:hypothetical protein